MGSSGTDRGAVLERLVRREPLVAGGMSGSSLERGWLDDGSVVIIKHVDARRDWLMQATGDDGRVAELWAEGFFDRLPPSVSHAMLDVRHTDGGAIVVMADVSDALFTSDAQLRAAHPRVLQAAAAIHRAIDDRPRTQLCALRQHYAFLSPQVCARFAATDDVPRQALEGWPRFHEIVPRDVCELVAAVHADPDRVATPLLERPCTLVHGDLKMANLGADYAHVVVVDWGTLTTWAPPAVDYAWYLAVNSAAVGRPLDRLLDDVRATDAGADDVALRLALVGALAQLGWAKALGATADDEAIRQRERAGLRWWTDQVRGALPLVG